jgi:hypothetical protein
LHSGESFGVNSEKSFNIFIVDSNTTMGEMALFNKITVPNLPHKKTCVVNNQAFKMAYLERFFLENCECPKKEVHEEKIPFAPRLMLRFLYGNFELRKRYGHAKGK